MSLMASTTTPAATFLAGAGVDAAARARTIPEAVVIGMALGVIVLILSLAVADLLVGLVVTPIMAIYELQKRWTMGMTVCDFWISIDVLVCTSSILHLVAIALDRYWSVTDVTYSQKRTSTHMYGMLTVVWVISTILSLAPIFGWKDEDFQQRVQVEQVCLISQEVTYQLFAAGTAFYIPLAAIIFIYWRVFKAVKQRCKRERDRKAPVMVGDPRHDQHRGKSFSTTGTAPIIHDTHQTVVRNGQSLDIRESEASMSATPRTPLTSNGYAPTRRRSLTGDENVSLSDSGIGDHVNNKTTTEAAPDYSTVQAATDSLTQSKKRRRKKTQKETAESKRERKAWRTLAIITGTFVLCWLPFFILAVCRPVFSLNIPRPIEGFLSWLGYLNSAINPIIYTIFSPDFRMAFQKMLKRIIMWK